MSYRFTDVIKKGETYWAVSSTTIGCIAPLKNVSETSMELPENEGPDGACRTLIDALKSPQKSTIKGKIVQISPLKRRRNGTLAVRSLALKDNSTVAKICLFENEAAMQFEREKIIEITSVYAKTYMGKEQLTASTSTKCQFLNDDNLSDIAVSDADHLEDHDFDTEEDTGDGEELVIDIIVEAHTYQCCSNEACRKKKLQNNKCPICNETSTIVNSLGCRIVVEVKQTNGAVTQMSLFNDDVFLLFEIQQCDLRDDDELLLKLCNKLPITFMAKKSKDRLYNIHDIKKD